MPAPTAAPVPYLNPTFDPNPPRNATSTTLETEPAPPKPPKPTQPKPPNKKPAPLKAPTTNPAPLKAPTTNPGPANVPTTNPGPANALGANLTPATSTDPKPSPSKATGTTLAPPKGPSTSPSLPKAPNPAHTLGRRGEDLVAKYVQTRGLILLCRNWRCREGEIDILATDGHMVVICEVKTRTTDEYGTPADAMNAKKIRCIKAATNRWLREYRVPYVPVRYDLAEVWWPPKGKPHLQYRRDAF
jgi:putative endonuclease